MSDYFTYEHMLNTGDPGSLGPQVSPWEMAVQNFRQQFRVDSALALNNELENRWADNLNALRAAGHNFEAPNAYDVYRDYAEYVRTGVEPSHGTRTVSALGGPGFEAPDTFEQIRQADQTIQQLHDPRFKTFAQILDEVSTMQRDVEEQTASMSERAGTFGNIVGMAGSIAGSFTLRDPLNVITAPVGAGRTVAMRVATDMAVAGVTTAITEFTDVQPNRAIAGLPERSAVEDIVASTLGAGLIRGGIEGIGAGVRRLHGTVSPEIDFDLRDQQLQQMFAQNEISPTARAASSLLDDTVVLEHSNPYGEGYVAGYRWQAELENTARALNGEPPSHLDLPPLPSEYIERHLSFQSVKETAPELWNELEMARTRLAELNKDSGETGSQNLSLPENNPAVKHVLSLTDEELEQLNPQAVRPRKFSLDKGEREAEAASYRARLEMAETARRLKEPTPEPVEPPIVKVSAEERRAANAQYQVAYQKVDQEAERLELAEAAKRVTAQAEAINIISPTVTSEPLTGPMTRFDFVEAHEARVTKADKELETKADAVNDLPVDLETNTVDIGTKTPVSLDFKVPLDEGELSVREILDDLAEDKRLEEAVRSCAI